MDIFRCPCTFTWCKNSRHVSLIHQTESTFYFLILTGLPPGLHHHYIPLLDHLRLAAHSVHHIRHHKFQPSQFYDLPLLQFVLTIFKRPDNQVGRALGFLLLCKTIPTFLINIPSLNQPHHNFPLLIFFQLHSSQQPILHNITPNKTTIRHRNNSMLYFDMHISLCSVLMKKIKICSILRYR